MKKIFIVNIILSMLLGAGIPLVCFDRLEDSLENDPSTQEDVEYIDLVDNNNYLAAHQDYFSSSIKSIIKHLNNPHRYEQTMNCRPTDLFLLGPSSIDKNLVSKVIAQETKRDYYGISTPHILDKYQDYSGAKVKSVFDTIFDNHKPSVFFIDDLDCSYHSHLRSAYYKPLLRMLHQQLKEKQSRIFVVAAAQKDALDFPLDHTYKWSFKKALSLPPVCKRQNIIENIVLHKSVKIGAKVLKKYADLTAGLSDKELKEITSQAMLYMLKRDAQILNEKDILKAVYSSSYIKPTSQEAQEIISFWVAQYNPDHAISKALLYNMAVECKALSAENLKQIVKKAAELSDAKSKIDFSDLVVALYNYDDQLFESPIDNEILRSAFISYCIRKEKMSFSSDLLKCITEQMMAVPADKIEEGISRIAAALASQPESSNYFSFDDKTTREYNSKSKVAGLLVDSMLNQYVQNKNNNCIQLAVSSQFDQEGISPASCGYHALKNSVVVLSALENSTNNTPIDLSLLSNYELNQKLFGLSSGEYRSTIIKKRRHKALGLAIYNILLENIKGSQRIVPDDIFAENSYALHYNKGRIVFHPLSRSWTFRYIDKEEERTKFKNILLDVAYESAYNAIHNSEEINSSDSVNINIENTVIYEAFLKVLSIKDQAIYGSINTREKIEQYFPNIHDFTIYMNGNSLSVPAYEIQISSADLQYEFNCADYLKGDWLDAQEIDMLINDLQDNEQTGEYIKNTVMLCLGDNYDQSLKNQVSSHQELKNILENFKQIENPQPFVIILHINGNHWISVIVNKQNCTIQYLLCDSAGNDVACNQRVTELVAFLDEALVSQQVCSSKVSGFAFKAQPCGIQENSSQADLTDNSNYNTIKSTFRFEKPNLTLNSLGGNISSDMQLIVNRVNTLEKGQKAHLLTTLRPYIFHGKPGSGKSTLAQAIAGETGRLFIRVSCAQMTGSYANHTADAIKALFEAARNQSAPVVICLDEIDALISTECKDAHGEYIKARAAFNEQLDKKETNILLIATTNNYNALSDALKSRFTAVQVDLPNYEQRVAILNHILSKHPHQLIPSDVEFVAKATNNWNIRNLEDVVELAGMLRLQEMDKLSAFDAAPFITRGNMDESLHMISNKLRESWRDWWSKRDIQLWFDNTYKGVSMVGTVSSLFRPDDKKTEKQVQKLLVLANQICEKLAK